LVYPKDTRGFDKQRSKDWVRINHQIRVPEVRLIDDEGNQMGVVPMREAMALAQQKELDLVEVAPNAKPPVCRIIDFGKFKYERKQREKSAKKKATKSTLKELKFRPKIGVHDINVRVKHARKFLLKTCRVRLVVRFRGREHSHPEIAEDILERVFLQLADISDKETPKPRKEGAIMLLTVAPNSNKIAVYLKAHGKTAEDLAKTDIPLPEFAETDDKTEKELELEEEELDEKEEEDEEDEKEEIDEALDITDLPEVDAENLTEPIVVIEDE